MRRFLSSTIGPSTACNTCSGSVVLSRCGKATFLSIAHRKRVEMFVGKRFHLPTRLKTSAPDVAAEWDHEKNPLYLYPEIVGIGHVRPVWWRCAACGHSYAMSVERRVVRGGGCPACATRESPTAAATAGALAGEANPALRPKRPTVLGLRTKY